MYTHRPNLHRLMTDAGANERAVLGNYPSLTRGDKPGYYYEFVDWKMKPCVAFNRWTTLSQWEPTMDGLGTM